MDLSVSVLAGFAPLPAPAIPSAEGEVLDFAAAVERFGETLVCLIDSDRAHAGAAPTSTMLTPILVGDAMPEPNASGPHPAVVGGAATRAAAFAAPLTEIVEPRDPVLPVVPELESEQCPTEPSEAHSTERLSAPLVEPAVQLIQAQTVQTIPTISVAPISRGELHLARKDEIPLPEASPAIGVEGSAETRAGTIQRDGSPRQALGAAQPESDPDAFINPTRLPVSTEPLSREADRQPIASQVQAIVSVQAPAEPAPASPPSASTPGLAPPIALNDRVGERLGVAIALRAAAGGEELVLRMDPAELGRIHVQLSFDEGGSLRAVVAADSPMVLDTIRRDAADLTRALGDAGVRTDAQSFRFDRQDGGGREAPHRPWSRTHPGSESAPESSRMETAAPPQRLRRSGRLDLMA